MTDTPESDQEREGFQPVPLSNAFLIRALLLALGHALIRVGVYVVAIIAAVLCSDFLVH